ncbi:MAG: hypothetical protein ACI4VN_03705 [Clostridia bacterium]|nr:hypothetical protein [Clostridia bacterium]
MKNEDEILSRLMSIETTNEEIYKELIRIQKDNSQRRSEELQMRIFIEDIYDFIKFTMQQKNNMENMEN